MSSTQEHIPLAVAATENEQSEYRGSRFTAGYYLLLPAGVTLLIFGRKEVFEKILLQLDRKYLSVICPCFIKKENILKWACSRLPPTWSSNTTKTLSGGIKELWKDGSLLCTLINTAIPGACPNPHRHWNKSPVHGQALAYKYFGITPIFTNQDLQRKLTSGLERKFIQYLHDLHQSINKTSENIEKEHKFTSRYIVRGMGLFSGEQHKRTSFYIYLNENCEDEEDRDENIIIQIKGPFGTYGETSAPKLVNKKIKPARNKRKQERRQSMQFIENLIQSNAWNFTRSQKKTINDGVEVETTMETDRIKVTYIPKNYGMYEIIMISNGELLKGCPFSVHIFINDVDENTEIKEVKLKKQKRKVRKHEVETNSLPNVQEKNEIKQKPDIKLTFNFKEVVEEITKNGTVYRNILGHTPEIETTTLEISAKSDNKKVLNTFNDDYKTEPKHLYDSLEPIQNYDIKQKLPNISSNNTKMNNVNEYNNKQIEHKQTSFHLEPKYLNIANINKIKIPEMFAAPSDDKYFKNILNETNRFSCIEPEVNFHKDKLNNSPDELDGNKVVRHERPEICYKQSVEKTYQPEVGSNIYAQTLEKISNIASPICPKHIVPEVENTPRTVAEKRKLYARGFLGSAISLSSKNSSFSDEIEKESVDGKYLDGVLNIVNNLQDSLSNSLAENWSMCSTVSLPNLSLDSDYSYATSVKDKRVFWENISSRSSSSVSAKSLSPNKISNTLTELERSKLIWKKPGDLYNNSKIVHKSADDILSLTNIDQANIKYIPEDNSLNLCTVLSIEERKRLLLEQFEKSNFKRKMQERNSLVMERTTLQTCKTKNSRNNVDFAPLSGTIRKFNSAMDLSPIASIGLESINKVGVSNDAAQKKPTISLKNSIKRQSHFKKAINFFKNLEMQSQKPKKKPNNKNNLHYRRGGSLSLPKISQKFFINNLYEDVFGNKKGSFRGAPNKSALVEALATFSRNPSQFNDNEDEIKYDIFKRIVKGRKRKSLKSVFDIQY